MEEEVNVEFYGGSSSLFLTLTVLSLVLVLLILIKNTVLFVLCAVQL